MSKRKATFTAKHAAENRAMLQRAKELLADDVGFDLDTVASQHPEVMEFLKKEFPGVTDVRISHRMAQAIRQLRFENKYHTID